MIRRKHDLDMRSTKPGEAFLGDKIPAPYTPHKHAALAMRLYMDSKAKGAVLSAFYARPARVVKRRVKRS